MKQQWINTRFKNLLMLVLVFFLAACSGSEESTTDPADLFPQDDFVPVISATGVVKPTRWVTLSFPLPGSQDRGRPP